MQSCTAVKFDLALACALTMREQDDGAEEPLVRSPKTPTQHTGATAFQTALNMLNELEGAGLLGLPYALRLCGWVSLACLLSVGALAAFTGYLLAMCMYEPRAIGQPVAAGRRVRDSYASVGKACAGKAGERAVRVVQTANLIAVGVVYLVLLGSSLHILVPLSVSGSSNVAAVDRRIWTAIATAAVLPTVHIGGYEKLSILSALGLLCLFSVIVLGVATSAKQLSNNGFEPMPSFNKQWSHLPAAFSIFVFAFSAHGVFPDLEASMHNPRLFPQVVGAVFFTNIVVKVVFSLTCFFAYGLETQEVVAANFPHIARVIVSILIAANTLLSFPLPLVPVFRTLGCAMAAPISGAMQAVPVAHTANQDGAAGISSGKRGAMRTGVVLLCGALAVAVPNFALAMGFMGSITLSFLTFIFPASFYLRLHGAAGGIKMRVACYIVVFVGILGGVAGIASNIALASAN